MDMSHVRAARDLAKPARKVRAEAPVLDAPTGLRDPRVIMGQRLGLVRTYCGPWVLMALTGRPVEEIRSVINSLRGRSASVPVKGTYYREMVRAMAAYGWKAQQMVVSGYSNWVEDRRWEPKTFAAFLRDRRPDQMQDIYLVDAGRHWILVKGRKVTCAMLGRWTWSRYAKKRRGTIGVVYRLVRTQTAKDVAAATKAQHQKVLSMVAKRKQTVSQSAAERAKLKRLAMAEVERLGCSINIEGRGADLFIEVMPPGRMLWSNGCSSQSFYGWSEALAWLKDEKVEDYQQEGD